MLRMLYAPAMIRFDVFAKHFLKEVEYLPIATVANGVDGNLKPRLVCNFGGSRGDLETWAVENDGAGFKAVDHHVFMEGAGNTDVEFGPDGRMYLSCFNNNGWYKEDIGNIYALYIEDALVDTLVRETHELLDCALK